MRYKILVLAHVFFGIFNVVSTQGRFTDEEIPNIETMKSDHDSIEVFFKEFDYKKLKEHLYLNYKAVGAEYWCDSIALKNVSRLKFPFKSKRMIIGILTPYCTYNITVYISRQNDSWNNATSLGTFTTKTQSMVIAEPIEDLLVTSKGKDHIYLRWKLSDKPNGPLREYRIVYYRQGRELYYTAAPNRCKLWPEYQCHDFNKNNILSARNYIISIIPINVNYLTDTELKDSINHNRNRFQNITVYTEESEPMQPSDLKSTWMDQNSLNVSWKHPTVTNGILKLFKIWITMEYFYGEKYLSEIVYFPLNNGQNDYKLEYSLMITLSADMLSPKKHSKSLAISVIAQNSVSKSPENKILVTSPPLPKEYNSHINIIDLEMHIPKPELDSFFEKLFIFTADSSKIERVNYQQYKYELKFIRELIETKTTESKIKDDIKINNMIETYVRGDNRLDENILKIDGSKGLFKNNTSYKVAIYTVNNLNDIRRVGRKILTVKSSETNGKTATTTSFPIL